MEAVKAHDPETISEAIVMWTGWGDTAWPARDDQRLVDRFGSDARADLLPVVRQLEAEFYESDAHLTARDLVAMGMEAGDLFQRLHPELSRDAVRALVWCYTFDHR